MTGDIKDPQLSRKVIPKKVETRLGVVEYAETGEGPVVVAMHGAMGGFDQSLILAQTIGRAGFRFIAMTRPGYLGTPLCSGKKSEDQGDLVAALLDSLGVARAGVLAVSGGGPAAVQFGLRHPDRCQGLVLVSTCADKLQTHVPFSFKVMTFLVRWPWFQDMFRKKAEKDLVGVARRSIQDADILDRTVNDPDTWPLFQTMLLSTFHHMGHRLKGTENDIRISASATFPLEKLEAPVLIVHGTQDRMVSFTDHAKMFEKRVPKSELLAIVGGEHVAIFTHRYMVKPKVGEFMQTYFAT